MSTAAETQFVKSILVWDLPTRIFHWSLSISFAVAYLTAESETSAIAHQLSGYLFAALIGFRLIWGLAGSRYARFAEFLRSPATTLQYLGSYLKGRPEHYIGHNPLGAIAVVVMLSLGIGIGVTGWLNVGDAGEAYEEVHDLFANAMLVVIMLHIAGVIASSLMYHANLTKAMITGCKPGRAEAEIRSGHGIVAALLIVALAAFGWGLGQGKLPILLDPAAVSAEYGDDNEDRKVGEGDDD